MFCSASLDEHAVNVGKAAKLAAASSSRLRDWAWRPAAEKFISWITVRQPSLLGPQQSYSLQSYSLHSFSHELCALRNIALAFAQPHNPLIPPLCDARAILGRTTAVPVCEIADDQQFIQRIERPWLQTRDVLDAH